MERRKIVRPYVLFLFVLSAIACITAFIEMSSGCFMLSSGCFVLGFVIDQSSAYYDREDSSNKK